jgi:hypothetical protein
MGGDVARFLQQVLRAFPVGEEEGEVFSDDNVMAYLRGTLLDGDAGESLAAFLEVVQGFCPALDASRVEADECVQRWFRELLEPAPDQAADAKAGSAYRTVDFAAELASQSSATASLWYSSSGSAAASSPFSSSPFSCSSSSACSSSTPTTAAVSISPLSLKLQQLAAVCPPVCDTRALQYVLEHLCGGRVDEAALKVLDLGVDEVERQFHAWDAAEAERLASLETAQAAAELKARKLMLARFDEFAVGGGNSGGASRAAQAREAKKQAKAARKVEHKERAAGKVRYLDDRVVTTRGEKFTVVSGSPEWDGGSKGKIITKGKRGPGTRPG